MAKGECIEIVPSKYESMNFCDFRDGRMKKMTLRTPNDNEVIFIGERSNHLSNVISADTARKMV